MKETRTTRRWKLVVCVALMAVLFVVSIAAYRPRLLAGYHQIQMSWDAAVEHQQQQTDGQYGSSVGTAAVPASWPRDREREDARRRVDEMAAEERNFVEKNLQQLRNKVSGNASLTTFVERFRSELAGYHQTLRDELNALRHVGNDEDWRLVESKRLGDLIHRRLDFLQNPQDCKNAKKLVCDLKQHCGLGCQIHHVSECLMMAYATRRTLILKDNMLIYSKRGLSAFHLPLSNCTDDPGPKMDWNANVDRRKKEAAKSLYMGLNAQFFPEYMPLAIPEDLAPRVFAFHADPALWWVGQFVSYITRPNKQMQQHIENATRKLGFKNPIVGLHIRRTDKKLEAKFYPLDQYMQHAEAFFDQLHHSQPHVQRRAYLATDDPSILKEARERYPNYSFITNLSGTNTAALKSRYSEESMKGILLDMYFLSLTDFIVCTFSSNVGRVAYELMQTYHGDASQNCRSLDLAYFFHGENTQRLRAVQKHKALNKGELEMDVGDQITPLRGIFWDGMAKGRNERTHKVGMYPTYKVVRDFDVAKMPTYPEVNL